MPEIEAAEPSAPKPLPGTLARLVGTDLGPRVVSAVVLGVLAFGLVWLGGWPFACLMLAAGVIVAWEWGRIVRQGTDLITVLHALSVAVAVVLAARGSGAGAVLVLLAGAAGATLLSLGHHAALSGLGVLYAGLPALALMWLRADAPFGLAAVLYVLAVVIATDTGAYFAGRLIGGPKLAPSWSPNKTWSGLAGGVAAAACAGAACASALTNASGTRLAIGAALLALFAQAGDIAESALKRWFGVKDASAIIPGHGGVMDRIDGLAAAAVAAAFYASLSDATAPARALIVWP